MTEEDFMWLVDKSISGEITEAEQAELEAHMAENEEARMLYEQTLETCDLLSQAKEIEPPPDLSERIMSSLDAGRYRKTLTVRSRRPFWSGFLQPRFRLVYAFTLGVVVGLLVYSQLGGFGAGREGGRRDISHLYGTIAGRGIEGMCQVGCLKVEHSDLSGRINLLREGELIVVVPDLDPGGELGVRIDFDPAEIRFEGFGSPEDPGVRVEVEDGYVRSFGTGKGRYVMSVTRRDGGPADLGVKIIQSGEIVYQGEFRVPVLN
jgi:hypothetical protein